MSVAIDDLSRRPQGPDIAPKGMNGPRKLYIKSYGCQMNVYDSDRMADVLAGEGFVETKEITDADLVILNTCHIREKAADKVYSELGRIRAMKDAAAAGGHNIVVAVAGCVAQAEVARKLGYRLVDHRLELYAVPLKDEKSN